MSLKSKITAQNTDFLIASGCTVFCSLIMFVYNLYVKTYVMPYEFGIYTTANLVLIYLGYLQLGVLNSFNRDYPRILGSGDMEAAEELRRNVFTFLFMLYLIIAVLGTLISIVLVRLGVMSELLGISIAVSSINAGLTSLYNFFDNSAKSEGHVIYASIVYLFRTVLQIAIGIFSVRFWGYYGMLITIIIAAVSPFCFFSKRILSIRLSMNKSLLIDLCKTGAPLLINALIWTVIMSVDRFVILTFMTMTDLGVYSTALLGFSTLVLVPSSISQVFYIKMSKKYGETGSNEVLLQYADKYTFLVSLCTAAVSLAAYYAIPIIVENFIPSYAGGIAASKILIVGVSLYSTTIMYSNILSVLKLNAKLIKNTIILCIFNIAFSTAFVLIFGYKIEHVAYGTALSFALYSILLILTLGKAMKRSVVKMLINSWGPAVCVILPCVIFSRIIHSTIAALGFSVAAAVLFCAILVKKRQLGQKSYDWRK